MVNRCGGDTPGWCSYKSQVTFHGPNLIPRPELAILKGKAVTEIKFSTWIIQRGWVKFFHWHLQEDRWGFQSQFCQAILGRWLHQERTTPDSKPPCDAGNPELPQHQTFPTMPHGLGRGTMHFHKDAFIVPDPFNWWRTAGPEVWKKPWQDLGMLFDVLKGPGANATLHFTRAQTSPAPQPGQRSIFSPAFPSTSSEQSVLARKYRNPTKKTKYKQLNSIQKQFFSEADKMRKSKSLVTDGRGGGECTNGKHTHPRRMKAV